MKIEVTRDNFGDSLIYTFVVWSVGVESYTSCIGNRGICNRFQVKLKNVKEQLED